MRREYVCNEKRVINQEKFIMNSTHKKKKKRTHTPIGPQITEYVEYVDGQAIVVEEPPYS
jgi:hypothetical protein